MPRIRPLRLDADSPFLDEPCALCQEPFAVGDKLVICPEDAVRHHAACWEANGNHCVALGCEGSGRLRWRSQASDDSDEALEAPIVLEGDVLEGEIVEPGQRYGERSASQPHMRTWSMQSSGCRRCLIIAAVILLLLCVCGSFVTYFAFDAILREISNFPTPTPPVFVTPTPII